MRLLGWRLFPAILSVALVAGAAAAQSDRQRGLVDTVLMRAVIERGAFLACARLDQNKQTADLLIRGWQLDLADTATILRAVGYSDEEFRALTERFDIEKASPKFADLNALGAYCEVLGDWRMRWARLQIMIPRVELRRVLTPQP